jgi:hypothetical protein
VTLRNKYVYRGLSAADYALVLSKEAELLDLEIVGHKEVIAQLQHVQKMVWLTRAQAVAVAAEIAWRREAIRRSAAMKRQKRDCLSKWRARQRDAATRMQLAQARPERRAA